MIFLKRIIRRIKYFPIFLFEILKWKYESCQKCGSIFRILWNVNDDIWSKVTGSNDGGGGSYCIDCFVKIAEAKNIIIESKDIELNLFYPKGK